MKRLPDATQPPGRCRRRPSRAARSRTSRRRRRLAGRADELDRTHGRLGRESEAMLLEPPVRGARWIDEGGGPEHVAAVAAVDGAAQALLLRPAEPGAPGLDRLAI